MHSWNNDWTGFFVVYFKWCYYLCVSPFRFEWDEPTKRFKIRRNPFQNLVCALQYFLIGIWYLKDLRKIPVDSLYKNPDVYFSLAFNLNAIYYHIGVFAFSFWRRQERFLAIVNFDCEGYAASGIKYKLLAIFLCFLFAILPLLYSIGGYSIISSSRMWDPSLMFRCLVVEGRFAFFINGTTANLARQSCGNNCPPDLQDISILDGFLGITAFLMEAARQVLGFYTDFFPLICCLSIWTCVESLSELLGTSDQSNSSSSTGNTTAKENKPAYQNNQYFRPRPSLVDDLRINDTTKNSSSEGHSHNIGSDSGGGIIMPYITNNTTTTSKAAEVTTSAPIIQDKVAISMQEKRVEAGSIESSYIGIIGNKVVLGNILLERYEVCKCFTNTVNRALGQLLFAYVLSSIMYLSTCMDAVLVLQDWFGKLRVAFFFLIFMLMFFIGSEIVNKVYKVRAWLSDPANNTFIPEKNLLVLIHEVTCKSIGVSGNGMFTITYSTFMTVMTTTVTFFIIILQFQKPIRQGSQDFSSMIVAFNSSIQTLNNLIGELSQLSVYLPRENYTNIHV